MVASKLSQQIKICSMLLLKSLLPQLMSFLGNDLKNQKKSIKNVLLIKIQVRGLQLYYKETPVLMFLCKFCEILKTLILETSVNGYF